MCIEAWIHAPERVQAADHQACCDQQHQSHCHFRDDEGSLRPLLPAAWPAPAFFQRVLQIRLRNSQRRHESKQNSAQQRCARREQQNFPIHSDFTRSGQSGRQILQRCLCAPGRYEQSQAASRQRQHHTLRQQLAHNSSSPRAQRCANGELTIASHRACHQQIGHVHARDQQHESDGCKQHQQQPSHVAHHLFLERDERGANAFVRVRIGFCQVSRYSRHVGPRLLNRHTWFQATNSMNPQTCHPEV